MKKKGFTLIELLAVIVILAIIAVIATPIITGIIEDSKKASFERSVEGIVKGLEYDIALKLGDSGHTYEIRDGEIEGLDEDSNVSISNTKGYSGTVRYDEKANVSYAIHNDKWCVIKIGDDITTTDYKEGECNISISTPETCFTTIDVEDGVSITDYDINTCGVDIVIPSKINNKEVVAIGESAFESKKLNTEVSILDNKNNIEFMSNKVELVAMQIIGDIKTVVIPDTVKTIGSYAFRYNEITNLVIGNGVTTIEDYAFGFNQLTSIEIPNSVTSIENYAFKDNQLTSAEIENSNTTIGCSVFYGNDNLTTVKVAGVDKPVSEVSISCTPA